MYIHISFIYIHTYLTCIYFKNSTHSGRRFYEHPIMNFPSPILIWKVPFPDISASRNFCHQKPFGFFSVGWKSSAFRRFASSGFIRLARMRIFSWCEKGTNKRDSRDSINQKNLLRDDVLFLGGGVKKYQQPTCERTPKHDATPMTHELIKYVVTLSNLALTCTDTPPPQQKHGKFHQKSTKLPLFAFLHPVVSRAGVVGTMAFQSSRATDQSSWDRNR